MIATITGTTGKPVGLSARLFDTVLVKVAARCNLACTYCYFFFSEDQRWRQQPAQMSMPVFEALALNLENLLRVQGRGFAVVLHGGEPLLLGEVKLRKAFQLLRKSLPSDQIPISIQTNGVLLTESLLNLCSEYRITLSVSIDGPQEAHDEYRLDHAGKSSFAQTILGIERLRDHSDSTFLFSGTLTVINPASPPDQIYDFLKSLKSPKLDFLYRDGNHDRLPYGKSRPDSTEYADWLCRLWNIYVADSASVPIRILDDTAKLILGAPNQKEGVGLSSFSIVIVDTDGSIAKNDTLKSSYEGADSFDSSWNITKDSLVDVAQTTEYREYVALQHPTSEICLDCRYLRVCGGGMTLYRWRKETGYKNPSVYCSDHQKLIDHISNSLWTQLASPR
jgi:uncharacterized protein